MGFLNLNSLIDMGFRAVGASIEFGRKTIKSVKNFVLGPKKTSTPVPKTIPTKSFSLEAAAKPSVSSGGRAFGALVHRFISSNFEEAFKELLEAVESHPVSEELKRKGTHSSKFLQDGDLFSFIGFPVDRNPVDDLIKFLKENIYISDRSVRSSSSGNIVYEVLTVHIPDFEDFKKDSKMKMPWESDNVWPFAIETYIAGYEYYLPLYLKKSRSLAGIQNENPVRDNAYTPTPYITPLLNKFKKDLESSGAKIIK